MVKIKTKKQLNLPQLIEWAMKNDMHEKSFCGDRYGDAVHFDENEDMLCDHISLTETFTVEVEEEITEDTPLSMIIECDEDSSFWVFKEITLKEMHESKCLKETTKYYKDEDEKMYLIWRDGKLVE